MKVKQAMAGAILTGFGWLTVLPAQAELAVVVAADSDINSLTAQQISDIFLGKNNTLPNGDPVTAIDQDRDSDTRAMFVDRILKRDENQLKAYWSRLIFTGKGRPPKAVFDGEEVIAEINDNPELIGYVDTSEIDDSVKAVFTLP